MIFQRLCVLSGKHASTRNDCLMDFKDYIIDVSASLVARREFDIYPRVKPQRGNRILYARCRLDYFRHGSNLIWDFYQGSYILLNGFLWGILCRIYSLVKHQSLVCIFGSSWYTVNPCGSGVLSGQHES
jgi:hypothetical protein